MSSDYISTLAENIRKNEECKEFMANNPDPRHQYRATYKLLGSTYSEIVMAFDAAEAERHVKKQCSLVGIYPQNIDIERV